MDQPTIIHGQAPDDPNAYTDGAMKSPANQFWGLLGYGVDWIERFVDNHGLTQQELNYTHEQHIDKNNNRARLS